MSTRQKIVINGNYEPVRPLVEAVTSYGQPSGAEVVYKGRRNTLFYILPGEDAGRGAANSLDFPVNVKAFRIPPFPNGYVYRAFRPSKAKRSYLNALKLLEMGFRTPAPLGYSEIHTGLPLGKHAGIWPKMTRSFYFCEQLPYENLRSWEEFPDRDALIAAFGAEIARIHAAGIWFHDFSPGNILLRRDGKGNYEFYYVDLNRMEFGVHDMSKLMQMFKSISWHDEWTAVLASSYAVAAGKNPADISAQAVAAAHMWRERHGVKEKIKRLVGKA